MVYVNFKMFYHKEKQDENEKNSCKNSSVNRSRYYG